MYGTHVKNTILFPNNDCDEIDGFRIMNFSANAYFFEKKSPYIRVGKAILSIFLKNRLPKPDVRDSQRKHHKYFFEALLIFIHRK